MADNVRFNSEYPQKGAGGVQGAHWSRVGLTQKNFFYQKMPVLEEKVG